MRTASVAALSSGLLLLAAAAGAQGTVADYERAFGLRAKYEGLAVGVPSPATFIEGTHKLWYRRSVKGGNELVVYDLDTQLKQPAFDHEKMATALSGFGGRKYTALTLPAMNAAFVRRGEAFQVTVEGGRVTCSLSDYTCTRNEPGGRFGGGGGGPFSCQPAPGERPVASPDGHWEAVVHNYNLAVREKGKTALTHLSFDGSETNCYSLSSVAWSPDSKKIAAYRVKLGARRMVHYVESSPEDQLQPKDSSRFYAKPGDVLDLDQPVLFHLETGKAIPIDNALFANPYDLSRLVWRKDASALTFEYNQRGHQVYRLIEVDAATGKARAVISEETRTFFDYRPANGSQTDSGRKFRQDVKDGKEVVWMSERDGWSHLYLYDGLTGAVKNPITRGPWVVRGVNKVDEDKRQIYFSASGMYPGQDPYLVYYYRINFDGSGLLRLTEAEANHNVSFSPDMTYYVDTYSRVDLPPVSELRRTADRSLVTVLEKADISELEKAGWRPPEVFSALGRDGKTTIWGVIVRPTDFDPSRKYPVVEQIYAGPQGSFVPKTFSAYSPTRAEAELGFIVVQIDGMGTANRSKAFHDVAWKNLGDAGLPDRILWHKAVAAKYPSYDISRVGIHGHSAGGQNALGALLFHPEFYKVCVSSCGCHDNRMDKVWWNEQWMGWPLGPEYAASSNVDNAYRLQGKLLLSVGEMDNNVDPSSTLQVVNALIKAKKVFDLLVLPGQGHSQGGAYGDRKRFDFFVHHLLGVEPPDWNRVELPATATESGPE
jgi:dipeptidyl aminopeptidase/acylaminoacyl peptidase